ncbi:hypothetical protein Tsubulata_909555 [Turnera subulata]|uniref:Ureide permease n=1 Tax=Turnera subulata TaxID=218843 RepID=A0A9Q0FKG6_9ROSI|nr:hypothetical protein Tsubulata_909555 [Turnera subulata]
MYVVESKGGAIVCMLLALFFLGTWPAVITLLERRGRLPQHTYLDYSITNLLAAVTIALTFGEIGKSTPETPNFMTQISQLCDNWTLVMFAMAGGVVLSLGNLSTQYAWAIVGLSVTQVIASSISVLIGFQILPHAKKMLEMQDAEDGSNSSKVKFGTVDFLVELENRRAIKVFGKSTMIGLGITLFAGLCFSMFSPFFNLATNDQWHTLKKGVPKLVVYAAFFWFSVSCFILGIILNITFLYRPVLNLPRSSVKAYLKDWNGRGWAFLAGFLCGFGNSLQFMGGQAAGYAAADAVQALPLVSTFWGVLLFGEYRRSSRKTYGLLVSMLFMFMVAVVVLMASAGHRKKAGKMR